MIPIALMIIIVAAVVLAAGTVWLVHIVVGLRAALDKFDGLEKKVDTLRESLDDLLIGNVAKEDIRAMIRRAFDGKR